MRVYDELKAKMDSLKHELSLRDVVVDDLKAALVRKTEEAKAAREEGYAVRARCHRHWGGVVCGGCRWSGFLLFEPSFSSPLRQFFRFTHSSHDAI